LWFDLIRHAAARIGPVGHATVADPAIDRVKVGLGHEERIVLRCYLVAAAGEVEADTVLELDGEEVAGGLGVG
jgi:hypothetical protein